MTPQQFITSLKKQGPPPLALFLGPEMYFRRQARMALLDRHLPDPEQRAEAYVRHDLDELSLIEVLDDARSMSLFAGERVLWALSAEGAMPRMATGDAAACAPLAEYAKDPTPGTTLVFDCFRYDFDGDDKTKIERVRKFYGAVPVVVECRKPDASELRGLAQEFAAKSSIKLKAAEIETLVDATAGDPDRLAAEIEKLAIYAATGRPVDAAAIAALVPNSQEATIFNLVNAFARGDRQASLLLIDTLVREGEYLPMVLTFFGGLLRYALAAKEAKLRSSSDIESHFRRLGVAMWRPRAEQVQQIASRFSGEQLARAIDAAFRADRGFKSSRPDDRTVLERFAFEITK